MMKVAENTTLWTAIDARDAHALVCLVTIIGRLRHNSLPIDQRDPGEFPCGTKKLGFIFCHKIWPKVQIVTSGLPKNLARFL